MCQLMVAQIIQMVIVPTVMISACTLIQSVVLNRYSQIGTRLRALSRERADFLATADMPVEICEEAMMIVDRQLLELAKRHRLIQTTALLLYSAMLLFLSSMMMIALAKLIDLLEIAFVALLLFLAGTAVLLLSVLVAGFEIRMSHQSIHAEMRWVMSLSKP